jgi:hypothetical protein
MKLFNAVIISEGSARKKWWTQENNKCRRALYVRNISKKQKIKTIHFPLSPTNIIKIKTTLTPVHR